MPLYVPDYLADTGHMSAAEHGAYLLLIMHYWQNGRLPDDDKKLARIARMTPDEWADVRETVAEHFYDGWKHKRVDAELAKADEVMSKRSAAGKAGASARHGKRKANAKQTHTPSPSPSQKEDSFSARARDPEPEALPPLDANGRAGIHAEFDQFMDAYPEKIGRKAASVVWPEARRSADLQTILDGLEHYVRNKPPDRNWMSPATFLENERWTDRYAERSSNGQRQSASGADNLGAALAELVDEERAGRRWEADAGGWSVDHDRPEGHSGGGGTVVDLRAVGTGVR